ncbi:MAG: WYL domain-containing protein [Anaerolineales bacterium]|nr:WYL domain-containing protein [Anaerolineales bacterium]
MTIAQPASKRKTPASAAFLAPLSLARCLAYLHYFTPAYLQGRCFAASHLRALSRWSGAPDDSLRSLRQAPRLLYHVALLQGLNAVDHRDGCWLLLPSAHDWLNADPARQVKMLQGLLADETGWLALTTELGLGELLATQQQPQLLAHLETLAPPEPAGPAHWSEPDSWELTLPASLPIWLQFELLQLGEWVGDGRLTLTPLHVARACQRGRAEAQILWLLEQALEAPLSTERAATLATWCRAARSHSVRQVTLLETAQPDEMAAILAQKRWRPEIVSQIGPRHTLISADLIPQLARWLAQQDIQLADMTEAAPANSACGDSLEWSWLGLRILLDLGRLLPLPVPDSAAALAALDNQLPAARRAELAARAEQILAAVKDAISGIDTFYPATAGSGDRWLVPLNRALQAGQPVTIRYLALGQRFPLERQVQPLRLEKRGALYYLYAYCYRVEENRTFRLDRIEAVLAEGAGVQSAGNVDTLKGLED